MTKKTHQFFDSILPNDLDDLFNFLVEKQDYILSGAIEGIPADELSKYNKENGPTTQLGSYYNIFDKDHFGHDGLRDLHRELRSLAKKACDYYGIDYESEDYQIHAWYNLDYKASHGTVSPLDNSENFHDHMGGEGAPFFHGYYCVNAEPSSTWYKINGTDLFENVNINNRAIVSETGHPHGRNDWYEDKPRITIAYDISPKGSNTHGSKWMKL